MKYRVKFEGETRSLEEEIGENGGSKKRDFLRESILREYGFQGDLHLEVLRIERRD